MVVERSPVLFECPMFRGSSVGCLGGKPAVAFQETVDNHEAP